MKLRPFWRYYGGKFRIAPKYPKPTHRAIIEPFAGAAGYSLHYHEHNVVLVEKYPVVAEIWRFLIGTTPQEVMRIPEVEHVDDLPSWVPEGGRYLVGFAMNSATTTPCKSLSAGCRKMRLMGRKYQGWNAAHRETVASQIPLVRHWRIIEGDYTQAPNVEATWFIDPPYQVAGRHYKAQPGDFASLGRWCLERKGQVMVCENVGAEWLPFSHFVDTKSASKRNGTPNREALFYTETAMRTHTTIAAAYAALRTLPDYEGEK